MTSCFRPCKLLSAHQGFIWGGEQAATRRTWGQVKCRSDIPERQSAPPTAERAVPRPRRMRSLLGTLVAGVIALLLIAIILAIVSKIGQLRLAQLGQQTAMIAPLSHSNRQALGLQAPLPLPERVARPEIPAGIDSSVPAPIVPAPQAELPPALQLPEALRCHASTRAGAARRAGRPPSGKPLPPYRTIASTAPFSGSPPRNHLPFHRLNDPPSPKTLSTFIATACSHRRPRGRSPSSVRPSPPSPNSAPKPPCLRPSAPRLSPAANAKPFAMCL